MTDYAAFLETKRVKDVRLGFDFTPPDFLYDFQKHIVKWALELGRAAIFADCGLGKTPIQLVWADAVHRHLARLPEYEGSCDVLIVAPLAVSEQTAREGEKFGIPVNICKEAGDQVPGINITNYERLDRFAPSCFGAVVLDESSILKNFSGKYRKMLTEFADPMRFRLACTATPAPNDLIEIINHSDFLGNMTGKEVIANYFCQDGNTTHKWRLKGHAVQSFWKWLASWAVAVRSPSDLGFDDGPFILPALNVTQHTVDGHVADGWLFPVEAVGLGQEREARRESLAERVGLCAEMANQSNEPWLIWCGLTMESEALTKAIPDAVEVKGSQTHEVKTERLLGFSEGKHRVMISKPSIAGHGMNWQHCNNMAFVGIGHSWEQYYQAVRRCWRFGQTEAVNVHVIVAETEGAVVENINRKEREAAEMMRQIVAAMGGVAHEESTAADWFGGETTDVPEWIGGAKRLLF